MFIVLGNDLDALFRAAQQCELEVVEGPLTFRYETLVSNELPDWTSNPQKEFDITRAEYVLRLKEPQAALCSKHPHEVGVFSHEGCYYAIWDGVKDGFGLLSYIGQVGERLRSFYILHALDNIIPQIDTLLSMEAAVDESENITMRYVMAQKTIKVRIKPDGSVSIETSGFKGPECKDATKQLEQALGTVVQDRPKPEMYAPPEQHATIRLPDGNS